jgi:Flp pilus assembly protein CpaB
MKRSKLTIALGIGAVMTGLGGAWTARAYIESRLEAERAADPSAYVQNEIAAVVANRDIQPGETLSTDMLAVRLFPEEYLDSHALTEASLDWMLGKVTLAAISRGAPIIETSLAEIDRSSVFSRIPEGMRAVPFVPANSEYVAERLRAGDRVDIHYTFHDGVRSKTIVLSRNVLILESGAIREPGAEYLSSDRVMVALNPHEAARLIHAQSHGELRIAVRSEQDNSEEFVEAVHNGNLFGKQVLPVYRRKIELIVGEGGSE